MIKSLAAAAMAAFLLAGCQSLDDLTAEQQAFVSCQGYLALIEDLHLFRDQLSDGQKEVILTANAVVLPTCNSVADGDLTDYRDALTIVTQNLARVFAVQDQFVAAQKEIQP